MTDHGFPGRLISAGVREERKLKLKLVVTTRFQWRFEPSSRHSVRSPHTDGPG